MGDRRAARSRPRRRYAAGVIVVVGIPALRSAPVGGAAEAAGLAVDVARAAQMAGASVQMAGKVGADRAGDRAVLALARSGIGHAAMLRDAGHATTLVEAADDAPTDLGVDDVDHDDGDRDDAHADDDQRDDAPSQDTVAEAMTLEAADLELALRYQSDFRVLVLAEQLSDEAMAVASEAAAFSDAHLVVVLESGAAPPAYELQTAFEAPGAGGEPAFAALVGRYAAALDAGQPPDVAFADATRAAGWEAAPRDA